jgi:hypothetical protein
VFKLLYFVFVELSKLVCFYFSIIVSVIFAYVNICLRLFSFYSYVVYSLLFSSLLLI